MSEEKITWSERAIETIATAMMKEPSIEKYRAASEEQKVAFLARNKEIIKSVWPFVPRGFSAVGAACCKCAIVYGVEPVVQFLQNVKTMLFNGRNDPAYVYRMWFDSKRRTPKDRAQTYEMTIIACKAYCEKTPLTTLQIGRIRDVFDWDENWEYNPKATEKLVIETKPFYTSEEVAVLLSVSETTIRKACREIIQAQKINCGVKSKWIIPQDQVDLLREKIEKENLWQKKKKPLLQIETK
jgi:hypothetical protein